MGSEMCIRDSAATALMAPMGMAVAGQVGVPAFLMAIMIGHGANAGALSPIAPAGVIVNGVMDGIGLAGYETLTYLNNMMAHVVVVFTAYFLFGGWRLLRRYHEGELVVPTGDGGSTSAGEFERKHWLTLGATGILLTASSCLTLTLALVRSPVRSGWRCLRQATNR